MKRFKRKQKKLKEKQTARLIAESPINMRPGHLAGPEGG